MKIFSSFGVTGICPLCEQWAAFDLFKDSMRTCKFDPNYAGVDYSVTCSRCGGAVRVTCMYDCPIDFTLYPDNGMRGVRSNNKVPVRGSGMTASACKKNQMFRMWGRWAEKYPDEVKAEQDVPKLPPVSSSQSRKRRGY